MTLITREFLRRERDRIMAEWQCAIFQEPRPVLLQDSALRNDLWGERRWRASRLAGLAALRRKVLPRPDELAIEQLRTKERQWAENMEREGLSPVEEAIAIQEAAELEQKLRPDAALGDLVEKVGTERGLHQTVARNLVALLKAPRSLQPRSWPGPSAASLGSSWRGSGTSSSLTTICAAKPSARKAFRSPSRRHPALSSRQVGRSSIGKRRQATPTPGTDRSPCR